MTTNNLDNSKREVSACCNAIPNNNFGVKKTCFVCGKPFTPAPLIEKGEKELESIVFQIDCSEKESKYFEKQLKDLFRQTLASQSKSYTEQIRGMKMKTNENYHIQRIMGYNQGIEDALAIISLINKDHE